MLETFTIAEFGIFAAIALFAGFVHGSIGLGFPLLSTAILSTFIDLRTAILITLLPTVTVNLISIARGGNWSVSLGRYWPLAVWCLIGSIFGAYVIVLNDPTPFKMLLALLIFLYIIVERIRHESLGSVRKHPKASNMGFGLIAGFSAGSTNTMVPILIVYSLEAGWAKTVMVQVMNMCFLSGKAAQLAVFSAAGTFNFSIALYTLPLAAIAAVGLLLGNILHDKINLIMFRKIIKVVLLLLGLILSVQVMSVYF
ncbi:MAG: sulfite exporter TauE/SafE family protein [Acidiferrobacterales bacterium]|nr:sulfite exporter TauE/SafE family protein [Acidiferrobacterales bacterium]